LFLRKTRPAEAKPLLERAIDLQRQALVPDPEHPIYRRWLRNHYWALVETLLIMKDHAAAARAAAELPTIFPFGWEEYHRAAGFLAQCAEAAAAQDPSLRQAYEQQAVQFLRKAMEKGFKDGERLREDHAFDALRKRPDFQGLLKDLQTP
jgi:hypothetical protein